MKKIFFASLITLSLLASSCARKQPDNTTDKPQPDDNTTEESYKVEQLERAAWSYTNPISATPDLSIAMDEPQRLEYFGVNFEDDATVTLQFPESTQEYGRAILEYRMGGWNQGPAEWDMTTQIMVYDKSTDEYYEIARAFTPYGLSFKSDWNKAFYIDVTEYLPMLSGTTEFKIHYGGWDATDERAHTVAMTYNLYKEGAEHPRATYHTKLYDSRFGEMKNRGWRYGSAKLPIEDESRLGLRDITIPDDVNTLLLKVSISGHGMEKGRFPERLAYSTKNAAEFDENTYQVNINGENFGEGHIFYDNTETYWQAGTYRYDRANWGPGLPVNTHYWQIDNIASERNLLIDIDLERYIAPAEDGPTPAYYIVQVDIFGW